MVRLLADERVGEVGGGYVFMCIVLVVKWAWMAISNNFSTCLSYIHTSVLLPLRDHTKKIKIKIKKPEMT